MTEHTPEAFPDSQEHTQTIELAIEKYRGAWGATYATEGVKGVIENYYIALFHPEHADDIPNVDAFEGRHDAMAAPIEVVHVPDFDTFSNTIRSAINRDANYEATLISGHEAVADTVRQLSDHGHLSFWSQGDNTHQAHKMRSAGIGDIRRTIAAERGILPQEVADVVVGDKFHELKTTILPKMKAAGEGELVVFDDRLKNLDRVAKIVDEFNAQNDSAISVVLSVVRHGKPSTSDRDGPYHVATNLSEIVKITEQQPEGVRILLDYDDTISDDALRINATLASLENTLKKSSWFNDESNATKEI